MFYYIKYIPISSKFPTVEGFHWYTGGKETMKYLHRKPNDIIKYHSEGTEVYAFPILPITYPFIKRNIVNIKGKSRIQCEEVTDLIRAKRSTSIHPYFSTDEMHTLLNTGTCNCYSFNHDEAFEYPHERII